MCQVGPCGAEVSLTPGPLATVCCEVRNDQKPVTWLLVAPAGVWVRGGMGGAETSQVLCCLRPRPVPPLRKALEVPVLHAGAQGWAVRLWKLVVSMGTVPRVLSLAPGF